MRHVAACAEHALAAVGDAGEYDRGADDRLAHVATHVARAATVAECGLRRGGGKPAGEAEGVGAESGMIAVHPGSEKLDLSGLDLEILPGSVQFLTGLTTVLLHANKLCQLPPFLSSLSSLKHLSLDRNSIIEVPHALSSIPSLTTLQLVDNYLTELPRWIHLLSNLKILDVSRNRLTQLPYPLVKCTSLVILRLADNFLQKIPTFVSTLRQLTVLDLLGNPLDDDNVANWLVDAHAGQGGPATMISIGGAHGPTRKHPLLRALAARSADAEESGGGVWVHIFASRRVAPWQRAGDAALASPHGAENSGANLYLIDANKNSDARSSHNPSSPLGALSPRPHTREAVWNLKAASPCSGNGAIGGAGDVVEVKQVWVLVLHKLTRQLDLSHCMLDSLPQSMSTLVALRRLTLDHNNLSCLPDIICHLPSLRDLSADHCRFTEVPAVLASEEMSRLVVLSLGNNMITSLPAWADEWRSLKSLNLEGNGLRDLPMSMRTLSKLTTLNLANNCFDLLPLCLGGMSTLQTVDVTGNTLRGLADWIDCPHLSDSLAQAEDNRQVAAMSWGARFSCRVCKGTGLVNNLDQARLEKLDLDSLVSSGGRQQHGPWALCAACSGLGSRLVPLALALLT